jgi:hypothetical protein
MALQRPGVLVLIGPLQPLLRPAAWLFSSFIWRWNPDRFVNSCTVQSNIRQSGTDPFQTLSGAYRTFTLMSELVALSRCGSDADPQGNQAVNA